MPGLLENVMIIALCGGAVGSLLIGGIVVYLLLRANRRAE